MCSEIIIRVKPILSALPKGKNHECNFSGKGKSVLMGKGMDEELQRRSESTFLECVGQVPIYPLAHVV